MELLSFPPLSIVPWKIEFLLKGLPSTHILGRMLADVLEDGQRVGLSGELGSGKTELVRSVVSSLGASVETLASPSYVLECIYEVPRGSSGEGRVRSVHHWDWYRLLSDHLPEELLDERQSGGVLTLVEWPERVTAWAEIEDLRCQLDFVDMLGGENSRKVELTFYNFFLAQRMKAALTQVHKIYE